MSLHAKSMADTSGCLETRLPFNAQLGDGSVVDFMRTTKEEHDAFFIGSFQRLGNPDGRSLCGGDFLNDQGEVIAYRVFRVRSGGIQCLAGDIGHQRTAVFEATDAAGGNDALAVRNGVVKEVLDSAGDVGHGKAFAHCYLPVQMMVCEGAATAVAALKQMLSEFNAKIDNANQFAI